VTRSGTDGEGVEQPRSSLHRLAPVALTALGIFGAVLMIFAGLLALNHTVLPFDSWPLNAERLTNGSQTLPRAPAETGRLRTANGGTLAEINDGQVVVPSAAVTAAALEAAGPAGSPGLTLRPRSRAHPQRSGSHSTLPSRHASAPAVAAPQPVVAAPAPAPVVASPAPVAAPVPAPVAHGKNKHASTAPVAVAPTTKTVSTTATTADTDVAHGHGNGHGDGHGNGQGKPHGHGHQAPAAPAVPVAAPAPGGDDEQGGEQGHGHGPPPWAHGNGKHS
jgi:hypothetical protein